MEIVDRLRVPQQAALPATVYVFYPWANARIGDAYLCVRERGLAKPPAAGEAIVVLTRFSPRDAAGTLFVPGSGEVLGASADGGLQYSMIHKADGATAPKTLSDVQSWVAQHPLKEERKGRDDRRVRYE